MRVFLVGFDQSEQHTPRISKRFTLHYSVGCVYLQTTWLSKTQAKRGCGITQIVIKGDLGSFPELFIGVSLG
jgi:hypothetical protein